jgi:Cys-rich protein (TIGR01571 family)
MGVSISIFKFLFSFLHFIIFFDFIFVIKILELRRAQVWGGGLFGCFNDVGNCKLPVIIFLTALLRLFFFFLLFTRRKNSCNDPQLYKSNSSARTALYFVHVLNFANFIFETLLGVLTYFCPCVVEGQIYEKIGKGSCFAGGCLCLIASICGFQPCFGCWLRGEAKQKAGLGGADAGDFFAHCCCSVSISIEFEKYMYLLIDN